LEFNAIAAAAAAAAAAAKVDHHGTVTLWLGMILALGI
jgi:hypothetical protein